MRSPRRLIASGLLVAAVVAVAESSSACLVWQNRWRSSLAVQTANDVAYVDDGDDKHRLDVFAPEGAQGAAVVIFVHGGFWRAGDRSYFEPVVGLYGNVGVALGDMGVVTVVPSYRLYPQVKTVDEQLDDIAATIVWTKEHIAVHGGDPNRIILAGHSAGGHLIALLATKPQALESRGIAKGLIKGVATISGIYDVKTSAENADPPKDRLELWDPFFGDDDAKVAASSLQHMGKTDHPPLLFVIGENDYGNCLRDHRNAEAALEKDKGTRAFFKTVPGNTHEDMVFEIGTIHDEVGPAVAAFARVITEPKP
jgi:acetyl esterase/lipase